MARSPDRQDRQVLAPLTGPSGPNRSELTVLRSCAKSVREGFAGAPPIPLSTLQCWPDRVLQSVSFACSSGAITLARSPRLLEPHTKRRANATMPHLNTLGDPTAAPTAAAAPPRNIAAGNPGSRIALHLTRNCLGWLVVFRRRRCRSNPTPFARVRPNRFDRQDTLPACSAGSQEQRAGRVSTELSRKGQRRGSGRLPICAAVYRHSLLDQRSRL